MSNLALRNDDDAAIIEQVIATGDLARLTPQQRVAYYTARCKTIGVNPLFKPFEYITLNGKLVLYGTKELTSQLRQIHSVSITKVETVTEDGLCIVTAYAKTAAGKEDSDVGAVPIEGLKGESRANAIMKATTKAKRRVTLSICGLSELDETEVASIPKSRAIPVNVTPDGEVLEAEQIPEAPLADELLESVREAYLSQIAKAASLGELRQVHAALNKSQLSKETKASLTMSCSERRRQLEEAA